METPEFAKAKSIIYPEIQKSPTHSVTVKSTRTGEEFIIARQYNAYDGWFVYKGCDLIVGDTTMDHAIKVLLQETR